MIPTSLDGMSIVVVGRFNPSIFSPAWLRLHNLIGAREAKEAEISVIVPPAAVFSTDWLNVDVTEDRLVLSTTMVQEFQQLRDVAVGVLTVLAETPVSLLGVNRELHWPVATAEAFHDFGDALVPKDFWEEFLHLPGTSDLTIESVRTDEWQGSVQVTVQPSVRVQQGVYARVNHHLDLVRREAQPQSRQDFANPTYRSVPVSSSSELIPVALTILRDRWTNLTSSAEAILQRLVKLSRE